jgi:signal transduction histidine kinase
VHIRRLRTKVERDPSSPRVAASSAGPAGSGLGLTIVAQHARAHGGRVWVEDGRPTGATFVVELPVVEKPA